MKNTFTLILIFGIVFWASPSDAQNLFNDKSSASGISNTGTNSGMAFGDYDNDGDEDLYVSVQNGANFLYQNQGNGTFLNVTAIAGVGVSDFSIASVWGDIDNDGDLDLYVANYNSENVLFENNGDGTFTDITIAAGVNDNKNPRCVLMADIDNDGFVEIYVANIFGQNVMYKNNGNKTFTDLTAYTNTSDVQIAMGSIFFDYDNDGDQDLYLTHDAYQKYILYENNGMGRFTDVSAARGANVAGQGMGVDFGDYNNDGFFDIYVTNLGHNFLLKNTNGNFTEEAFQANVADIGMGWGTFFFDYNNDGWSDIYVVNDYQFSPQENVLYKNLGNDSFAIVGSNTNISSQFSSYGAATADINNDGWIDMAVAIVGSHGNQLFENNDAGTNQWIKVKTEGVTSNRAGIGTRVEIYTNGMRQMNEVAAGRGYASANSLTMHFGVGNIAVVDTVILRWSSGQVDKYYNVPASKYYLATEGTSMNEMVITNATNINTAAVEITTAPNPFTSSVRINFNLKQASDVSLQILNVNGQLVRQIHQAKLSAGIHEFEWNGTDENGAKLSAGTYFYFFKTEEQISTGKIIYMK